MRDLEIEEGAKLLPMLQKMYISVSEEDLTKRYDAIASSAWRCIGVFSADQLVGMAGYWVNTRFYCGRFLYVDHFYINPEFRRERLASQLIQVLRDRAREEGCTQVCLDTFVGNQIAQHLWFKEGFSIVGFHFVHPL